MLNRFFTISLLLLLCGVIFSPIHAASDYDKALSYYYAGDYAKAAELLEDHVEESPNNQKFLLSLVYLKQNKTDQAQDLFSKVDLDILNIEDYADLVALQFFPTQADEVVQKILKKVNKTFPKKPLSFQLYLEAGNQYYKKKNWRKAAELFQQATDQDVDATTAIKAYQNLISLSLEQKEFSTAYDCYKDLLLLSPKTDDDGSLLKRIQIESGAPKSLSALFPSGEAQLQLFRAAYDKEAYVMAKTIGKNLMDQYPHLPALAEVCTHTGLCFFLTSQYQEALDTFKYVMTHYPQTYWANKSYFYTGRSYQKITQITKAKDIYLDIINQKKTTDFVPESYYYLYWAMMASDQENNYTPYFLEFRKRFKTNEYLDKVTWELAWKQTLKGNYSDAYSLMQGQSWTMNQDQFKSKLLFWSGKMNQDLNLNKAKYYYNKCLQKYPFSYYAYRVIQAYFPEKKKELSSQFRSTHIPMDEMGTRLYRLGLGDIAINHLKTQIPQAKQKKQSLVYTMCYIHTQMNNYHLAVNTASLYGLSLNKQNGYVPLEIAQILYPRPYWDTVQECAKEYNIDPYFVLAVMREESNFNPQARSRAGALGLLQIMPSTGEGIAKYLKLPWQSPELLRVPEHNIRCGTYFLACLKSKFGEQYERMLSGYNAGPNITQKWVNQLGKRDTDWFVATIPYSETHYYVTRVLKSYWVYKLLYNS